MKPHFLTRFTHNCIPFGFLKIILFILQWILSLFSYTTQKYVQERIEDSKEAEQLIADICDSNGHIYVCGDVSMADRVCRAFEVSLFLSRSCTTIDYFEVDVNK